MAPKPGPFVCVERTVFTNGPLSFPKIRSGLGSPREAETLHHPGRPDLISGRDKGLITDESLIILFSRECSSLTPSHASACLMDGLRFRSRERTHVPTQRKTRAVH